MKEQTLFSSHGNFSGFAYSAVLAALVLAVSFMVIADSGEANAYDTGDWFWDSDELIEYKVIDADSVEVVDCSDSAVRLVIPASVTAPDDDIFSGKEFSVKVVNFEYPKTYLVSAVLSEGIEQIGYADCGGGFWNCWNLAEVSIPESVTLIGRDAFDNCRSLSTLYLPDSVTFIAGGAFEGSGLTSVKLPDNPGYTTIEEGTFYYCPNLQSVVIPSYVTSIGRSAFEACCSLSQIVIPENVTKLDEYAFTDTKSLIYIDLRCGAGTDFGYRCLYTEAPDFMVKIRTTLSGDMLGDAIGDGYQVGPDLTFGYMLSGNTKYGELSNHAWELENGHLKLWSVSPEDTHLEGSDCFCVRDADGGWHDVKHLIREVEFVSDADAGKYLITSLGDDVFYWDYVNSIVLPEGFEALEGDSVNWGEMVKLPGSLKQLSVSETTTVMVPDSMNPVDGVYLDQYSVSSLIVEVGTSLSKNGLIKNYLNGAGLSTGVLFLSGSQPMIGKINALAGFSDGYPYISDTNGKVYRYNPDKSSYTLVAGARTVVYHMNDGTGAEIRKVVTDRVGAARIAYKSMDSFAGWFTSPQGGEFVSPDSRFADYSGSSILELYAHWDGAFVVLGTGVTATVGSISYTGYATVPMNGAMELSFDDGLGFYYAYGFDVSGNVLTPVNGSSFFTVAAKPADYTQVDLALGGGESACTGFRVTPGSALPASYVQPSRTGYDFGGYKNVGGTIVIPAVSGSGTPSFAPDVSGFTDHNRCWINTSSAVTLTAVWIPHTTRVIYHNMGVTPDVEETAVYGQDFPFIESPVSSDARFEGYCDAVTPDGKASGNLLIKRGCYYAEEGLSPYFDGHYTWIGDIEEFHLYALWIPKYVLKVDGVSADLSGDEVFEVQTPSRAGYSFTGWLLSGAADFSTARYGTSADSVSLPISDGTVFSADPTYVRSLCSVPGGIVMMNSQWEPVTYRVIFNLDGGIGPANTDMVYDTVYEINSPTRSGYFFAGWTISGNATAEALYGATEDTVDQWFSGTCYTGSSMFVKNLSFDPSKRVMLTAVWGQGAYTVRFDPNAAGTEGEMQDQLFSFGLSQNLYRCDYSRTGYAFSGWAVTPGGGVVYKDCQNVTDIASENGEIVTLYAVWTIQQYTFSFRNTGATAIENITLDYGAAVPVPADPEYPKYVFIGWSYLGNLTEIPTVMPARDMEFSAVWEPDSYTVSFDSNGGRGTMGSVDIVYFQTSLLPANVFTKTGYKFASWNTQKNGGGVSYADKAPVTDLGDTVLYAQWAAVKYTVVFHSNTDPEMTSSQIMTYGVSKKLAYNTFENPGYAFDSWNTKADGSGTSYVDGQTVRNLAKTDGAVVNLYAKWTPVTAYITLAKGDHGAADGLAHVSYGDARAIVDTPVIGVGHDVLFYGESVSGAELTPVIYPDGTLEEGSSYVSGGKWIYTGTSLTLTACCVDPLYDGMEFAFEGLKYKVISAEKRTASLIGSEGNITKLTVPEKAVCLGYELSVTSIGANAFFKSPTLKSADLGSVTTIGNSAFKQCGYLASVDVGENLKSIGSYAFYKCFALKTINLEDSAKTMKSIGGCAFKSCSKISRIAIPSYMNTIGKEAFTIPFKDGEEALPMNAADLRGYLYKLEGKAFVRQAVPETGTVIEDGTLVYSVTNYLPCTVKVIGYSGTMKNLTVPDKIDYQELKYKVTAIGEKAFYGCKTLVSADLGIVTSVGTSAFENCTKLGNVKMDKVKTIGQSAFRWCSKLSDIDTGESLQDIKAAAFYKCRSLTALDLPDSLKMIASAAFKDCAGLQKVSFGTGLTKVEATSFSGTTFKDGNAAVKISADTLRGKTFEGAGGVLSLVQNPDVVNTVRWYDWNGLLLYKADFPYGTEPYYGGPDPSRSGYYFAGWIKNSETEYVADYSLTPVMFIVSVVAQPEGYGSVSVQSFTVDYGTAISASGNRLLVGNGVSVATPAASTSQYTYYFTGWNVPGDKVTESITVIAGFERAEA